MDELLDVVIDAAALLDRADDRGKVVVGQHHVGGFFGHVSAGDAHCHADVGALDGGRVVHAVAGHRHDLIVGAQCVYDAHLVLRRNTGEYVGHHHFAPELFVAHFV